MIELSNNNFIEAEISEIIRELKSETDGLFYKSIDTSNNYMICCPFHKEGREKKPSMGIHKKSGVCHCFACEWVGSLGEMISGVFGYDDFGRYGEKWLLQRFKNVSVENRKDLDLDLNRKPVLNSDKIYVSEEELDKYRYIHPYMYKRKLTDEIIELFDIGYDKETDCITFPNKDINGNCLFIARRSVKTKFFNYPEGVEKPVYGLYEIRKYKECPQEIIICESMLDALTCWVYGKQAVALNGLGDDFQFKILRDFPCRKYILATDMDERGLQARRRIKKAIPNKLISEYKWDVNVAKDINDMSKDFFDSLQEFIS